MTQVTLVTGGSRGIGAATCRLLGQHGHHVAVNYLHNKEAADNVVCDIEAAGGKAVAIRADTGDEKGVVEMFKTIDQTFGGLNGLVNNAGIIGRRSRVDGLDAPEIREILDTNVLGYMLCAREAVVRMSTKYGGNGGAIVNVSSGSANLGNPGNGVLYAVSKGAVNSLTIGLSQEVAAEGIRVNAVAPGMTRTDMPGEDRLADQTANIPMGRVAEPNEIAEAIHWLLTDKASYVAGANLRIGGGRL